MIRFLSYLKLINRHTFLHFKFFDLIIWQWLNQFMSIVILTTFSMAFQTFLVGGLYIFLVYNSES